jgi:hypothetical protein
MMSEQTGEQLQEQTDRPVASQWTPVTVHPLPPGQYRVCFAHRGRSDARSETIEQSLSAAERDAETDREELWSTIHVEPWDAAQNQYDVIEAHEHTAEVRAYRVGDSDGE